MSHHRIPLYLYQSSPSFLPPSLEVMAPIILSLNIYQEGTYHVLSFLNTISTEVNEADKVLLMELIF